MPPNNRSFVEKIKRTVRYFYLKVVRMNDEPESIAKGMGLGVFIGIFPTFGIGIFLAIVIAALMKWNKASAIMGSFIMNPLTTPFFWAVSASVGAAIFGLEPDAIMKSIQNDWIREFGKLAVAYLTGNFIISLAVAIFSYYLTIFVINTYKKKREKG